EAEERLPAQIRQRPFRCARDVIEEPLGAGRDLLDVDADGHGSHDGRHEPRLVREGPEGPAEGKRGIAVTLLQWPKADPAGFATQRQGLARTPALGLQSRPPVKAQILWQELQDDRMELHGSPHLTRSSPQSGEFFLSSCRVAVVCWPHTSDERSES